MPVSGTFATRVLSIGTTVDVGQNRPPRSDFSWLLARQVIASFPTGSHGIARLIAPNATYHAENTLRHSPGAVSNLVICSANEKITAIFIVFLPFRALHLHPVAFARFVGRVLSLRHDALEPAGDIQRGAARRT